MDAKKLIKWSIISYIIFAAFPLLFLPIVDFLIFLSEKVYIFWGLADLVRGVSGSLAFLWPYPLLFSLIALFGLEFWFESIFAIFLADILGLIIVWYWAREIIAKYGPSFIEKARHPFPKLIINFILIFSWIIPLALLELIIVLIVNKLLGLPVGP